MPMKPVNLEEARKMVAHRSGTQPEVHDRITRNAARIFPGLAANPPGGMSTLGQIAGMATLMAVDIEAQLICFEHAASDPAPSGLLK